MKIPASNGDLNHNRLVVEQVIADVMKTQPKQQESKEAELIKRSNIISQRVASNFATQAQIKIKPTTYEDAVRQITVLYKDEFTTWSKDDLLQLLSLQSAVLGAESLRSELI